MWPGCSSISPITPSPGRSLTCRAHPYQLAAGEWVGQPFLELSIPKNGLLAGAGGESLKGGDSVLVTLTIDSVNFSVDFQPSGVVFSTGNPATLVLWYENANPDLNGDGALTGANEDLTYELVGTDLLRTDGARAADRCRPARRRGPRSRR